ncbi:MAG: hypothetical protein ACKOCD_04070 [Nitrospiraceae bacterium]
MKRVGIFTATRWEQVAVSRAILIEERARIGGVPCAIGRRGACWVSVFRTGMGPVKASEASREVFASCSLDLAVSSGYACALTPSQVGDLLIGTDVCFGSAGTGSVVPNETLPCSKAVQAVALESGRRVGMTVQAGRFVSVGRVLWLADEKRHAAAGTGATGLDMESAAIGVAAKERQVPFVIARTVSDLLDEDLPLDFNLFLAAKTWPQGLWQGASRPSCLAGILRLRRQSQAAASQLTRFMGEFLNALR